MVKHCPQLGSTWPRSVHFWKVKLTYFPVICQYLTLIWQKKKAFGTASSAHSGVCFLSASLDDTLSKTIISFCLWWISGWHSKLILMWMWRHPVVIIISKSIWRTAVHWLKKIKLAGFGSSVPFLFALSTLICRILELSIIYIKNDMRIIYQFISVTTSDMLNVQCCWQWQFRTWGTAGKQTWSRLSIAIIKHHWTQHLLTLQRSQSFPQVRKMGTI